MPAPVKTSLFDYTPADTSSKSGHPELIPGLLTVIRRELENPRRTDFSYSRTDSPIHKFPLYLVEYKIVEGQLQAAPFDESYPVPDDILIVTSKLQQTRLSHHIAPGFYWVHDIRQEDESRQWSQSIWFWPATVYPVSSRDLRLVLVRDLCGTTYRARNLKTVT